MKTIALSWHPSHHTSITAGGYKRFWEIASRCPVDLLIIDRSPSLYSNTNNDRVKIIEYKFPLFPLPSYIWKIIERILVIISSVSIVLRLNREKGPPVIYIPFSELVELSLAGLIIKWITGGKLVLCNLNVNTYFIDRPLNVLFHRFANRSITISHALKSDLARTGIKIDDVNGVGFSSPSRRGPHRTQKYDAIFIGRHISQKGIFDLINIWDILINHRKLKLELVTIGDVPKFIKQKISSEIRRLRLCEYIHLMGVVTDTEKIEYLAKSKLMVFPSHQEGWGIAPMEALSQSLPVVAYNLPVYSESIGSTPAFRVSPIGDIKKFADLVIDTLSHLKQYQSAASTWTSQLDWKTVAAKEWEIICYG